MAFRRGIFAAAVIGLTCGGSIAAAQDEDGGLLIDPELERPAAPEMELPDYDAARGRELYVTKGCVVCHAVNDVGGDAIRDLGGETAPPLDASRMPIRMDPFIFFTRMWRGAQPMIALQEQRLGYQITLDGAELADIMAFIYDPEEQAKFTPESFTPPIFWYRDEADIPRPETLASDDRVKLGQSGSK